MALTELKEMLKNGRPTNNVFLLYGEEVFLKSHYLKKLTELLMPDAMQELNFFQFTDKAYNLAAVDEAIESLPVFAESKLIIFSDSQIFKPDGRTGAKAEYRDYWEKRIKDIPENVYLIFDENEIDKRSALYKYVNKNQMSVEFGYLSEAEMINWTVGLFKTLNKTITREDAAHLVEITDSGMLSVKKEAEKLAAYTENNPKVTRADIDELVTPSIENKVFEMIDALVAKNVSQALIKLNDLFLLKEDANRILGAIIYNVDKLINTKLLTEQGKDKNEIISKLKIAPFQAAKYLRDCGRYSEKELSDLLMSCAKTDSYLKSNSMDNNTLLELLIVENSNKPGLITIS